MNIKILLTVSSVILLVACSHNKPTVSHTPTSQKIPVTSQKTPVTRKEHNLTKIEQLLFAQYQQWKGTPYRYGGLSKQGIDCSGFVFLTFKNQFGVSLGRTTVELSKLGQKLNGESMQAGDLVFFKVENKITHVGIYIADRQFIHASTSRGVMISSLDNIYWQQYFWKANRINQLPL